jgi:hypothetical protein
VRKAIKLSYQVTGIIVALLWLFQASAVASIYKWRDDQGKLHFTDDRAKIPPKYLENVQKFKGVTEPKPKEEAPPEEEQGELESGQDPLAAVEPPPEEKPKPAGPPPLTEEEKATMTAVYRPLITVWNRHVVLLMEGEPVDKYLKQYVGVAQSSAASKKAIAKTIGKNEHPLLVEIKSFLKKSARKDARLKEDHPGLMHQVVFYKKRLMKEIPIENEFIVKLYQKLELETPPPLITLEEALQKAAERRELIEKSKRRRKNSQSDSDTSDDKF